MVVWLLVAPVRAAPGEEVQAAPAACAVAHAGLQRRLQEIAGEASVARAHWGVAVSDVGGPCLAQMNADRLFHPASTAKLLTTAAVMSRFGPEARVTTRLEVRGVFLPDPSPPGDRGAGAAKLGGRVLRGDLALVGAGDGALGTNDIPYRPVTAGAGGAAAVADEAPTGPESEALTQMLARFADAAVAAGVVEVDGDVVGDDTSFAWEPYPDDWAQDDLQWGYGAPVSALSVHDNEISVVLSPGATAGAPVITETEDGFAGWLRIDASELRTGAPGSGTHVGFGALPGGVRGLRAWGSIAVGTPDLREEFAIGDPALFAAEALRAMLVERGIRVNGTARAEHRLPRATVSLREQAREPLGTGTGRTECCVGVGCVCPGQPPMTAQVLAEVRSPTVAEDVLSTNKESLNLHAELLLERLGEKLGEAEDRMGVDGRVLVDAGSRAQGVRVVRSVLVEAGVDPEDVVLVDGSGLSTHDLVTPAAMTRLLVWASGQPWFATWKATLPVGGVDGTLAGRFTKEPLTGRVQAKTGTMGESRALAGYLKCASGRVVAFSVMVDGRAPGETADREAMDQMVEAIYRAD